MEGASGVMNLGANQVLKLKMGNVTVMVGALDAMNQNVK
jgi:prophage tail gpP-like protein